MSGIFQKKMSYQNDSRENYRCFKIIDNLTKKPITCGEYLNLYYNFIAENPLKFSGDFIEKVGQCNIMNCDLPSDR